MREREQLTRWLLIIVAALLLHIVLLLCVKPSVFHRFSKGPGAQDTGFGEAALPPHAILSIPIEVEHETGETAEGVSASEYVLQDRATPPPSRAPLGDAVPDAVFEIVDMVGEASRTRPQGPDTTDLIQTLPRPLEITWPDTRRLNHCLDLQITVRILVDDRGVIQQVVPHGADQPPDCVRAAVEAAKLAVFAPGTINGKPVTMWTRVRIDFRRREGR